MALVREYHELRHTPQAFVPGHSPVPVSGRVFAASDMVSLTDATLDFWLTAGRFNDQFEQRFGERVGARHVLTVNSGSSANLVALSALTSPKLRKRRLMPGDEVITAATGFPTTINPAIMWGLKPVFVDIELGTYNIDPKAIEQAVGPATRAIMVAHTLGNPFDLAAVKAVADKHGLYLIEDCCDALGATFDGRHVGTFGAIGTCSFYPAHHITMGEGGAVFTNDDYLKRIMESFRDWGRDCYCAPGADNTCGRRFGWKMGDLPQGYDHKYTYSHLGFNLKITDMQAAVGVSQLDHLEGFIHARRRNFSRLREGLSGLDDIFILPHATPRSEPSWFGFVLTIRPGVPFDRTALERRLNERKIGTRLLFGGNLVRQPYMSGRDMRVSGTLENADLVMANTLWIGVYPGLTDQMIDYVVEVIQDFCRAQ